MCEGGGGVGGGGAGIEGEAVMGCGGVQREALLALDVLDSWSDAAEFDILEISFVATLRGIGEVVQL